MRIVLVGTDLVPVRPGAGALETLLDGWATGLAADHDVTVASVAGVTVGAATGGGGTTGDTSSGCSTSGGKGEGGVRGTAGGRHTPSPYRVVTFQEPDQLRLVVAQVGPDAVVLNNRPAWQRWVTAPTLHLFHNWPDAWEVPPGVDTAALVGGAAAAAVSRSLAATVATELRRPSSAIGVVRPFVGRELFAVEARPEAGLILSPNRLMVKKGVRELAALAGHPSMRNRRVLITDYLSPWTSPTAEHIDLRAVVESSAAELIPPPADRAAMAALYARAEVVVCPSIRPEGLGLTALEAQAVGIPVVSSGLGGLAEASLLADLIADPTDPVAFAGVITRAAALDPSVRRRLRHDIRTRYSSTTSLASLLGAVARSRPAV